MGRGSLELVVFAGDSPHTGKLKERGLVTRLTSSWMRLDSGGGARRIHLAVDSSSRISSARRSFTRWVRWRPRISAAFVWLPPA
jgi:hypothetical protein